MGDGLDDPLELDLSRCTAVKALAVDRKGNVYMALQNAAMIVGLTPDGEMRVVAGTGLKDPGTATAARPARASGWSSASPSAPTATLVSEAERVRRIADPAGILAADLPEAGAAAGAGDLT